ncbi:MAG: hypothetical protein OXF41_15640 [bacterium]|nr:hypothetical protein [bacterium]
MRERKRKSTNAPDPVPFGPQPPRTAEELARAVFAQADRRRRSSRRRR